MHPFDIESLERATVEGVAPADIQEIGGWLVPLSDSAIQRAKSAVPLRHDLDTSAIDLIEAAYWSTGLKPAFRVAEAEGLLSVRELMIKRGYLEGKSTLVKVGDVARVAALRDTPGEIMDSPDDDWGDVFVGPGFDRIDGVSRVAALTRSPDAVYGRVRESGRTVAVGVGTFGHGWLGIHGMRTDAACRGRGLASQVLAALGRAAEARGITRAFLQVEADNDARSLYRKASFVQAWRYRYWTRA